MYYHEQQLKQQKYLDIDQTRVSFKTFPFKYCPF